MTGECALSDQPAEHGTGGSARRERIWRRACGRTRRRGGFTIIELLTVVAIISLLMSIMLPALRGAREQARRIGCLATLKNCGPALRMYASENERQFPRCVPVSGWSPHMYYSGSSNPQYRYDLPEMIRPYLGDLAAWTCSAMRSPPLDDPANTRSSRYGTFEYFPGRRQPRFDTDEPVPDTVSAISSRWPILQDFTALYAAEGVRFTHGRGRLIVPWPEDCPTYRYMLGDCDGANILHGDLSAAWYRVDELEIVGSNNGTADKFCLSILP